MNGIETARRLIADEREKKTGSLDLGNLNLTEVPPEILTLTHLCSLNLGSRWDEFDYYRRTFEGWNESANELDCLPDGFGALCNLRELGLVDNPISDLGPLRALTALQSLDCAYSSVSDLGPLQTLTELQSLNCSNTSVSDLDPLKALTALQSLDCYATSVSDLGPLRALNALQSLDCNSTSVSDVGPLGALTALRRLVCYFTQVSDLSPLRALTALQSLDCAYSSVSDLGPLQTLTALQSLNCSNTPVSHLGPLRALTALQSLNCFFTSVSDLSPLRALTALQSLDCSNTPLSDVGPLRALTALQSLDCSNTSVSDLGPLRALTALQSLRCSHTPVSDLGPLRALTALQSLRCSHTPVSDLGPLQTLAALQSLDCSNTTVSDLGPLRALIALRSLDCSNTQVSELTPLTALPSLTRLWANECRLSDLPRNLVQSETLLEVMLHRATIPGIPVELLSDERFRSCLDNLRGHLTDLEVGAEEVTEAKLVVLGNGRVGKTQLCRRLRGLPYDETVDSTHGITVTAERWSGSTGDDTLNIWDFGGQDIYHGVHTLFMQTSAVFLIAWHPDFETAGEQTADGMVFRNYPLPYWLEYVRTLGRKDCPVVVVQVRCDRPEQEVRRLPADDASLTFPSLKPCWYSAKTNRGRGALEDAVRDAIHFLRERDGIATIGAGRMRVLRQLEAWRNEDQARPTSERQHRTLSQAEFRNVCEHTGGVSSPDSLLAYLHNLGVVFYQPTLFHDRIILDQAWALEAVYAVFDRRSKAYPFIVSQHGKFTASLLAMTAWREYAEPEQRLFLSLMESCGIAFKYRTADPRLGLETEYVAPDLLPGKDAVAAQLAGRWNDDEESWRLEYEYPFPHPGLMRALLCDVGQRSGEAGVYWKYGVWVYDTSTACRAWLEQQMADDRRGRITLRLQGRQHDTLASWIRERIEYWNRLFGYAELKPAVNEFGSAQRVREPIAARAGFAGQEPSRSTERSTKHRVGETEAARAAPEPTFQKPPASFFLPREPQVFVSYAWGDDTPEGRRLGKLVDDLCEALGRHGVTVRRDRNEMPPGALISEFMDRLADGDVVLAVISDRYLQSLYCMYELFRIYRNCADKPERFLGRVIPLILPDARLDRLQDRLRRATYWTEQEAELTPQVNQHVYAVGKEFYGKFKLIGEFARNTSDMLEHLIDKLQPRDFERQAAEGFPEVLSQIRKLG